MLFFTKEELKCRISSIKQMIDALNLKKNYFEKLLQDLEVIFIAIILAIIIFQCSADKQCLIINVSLQDIPMDAFMDCDVIEMSRDQREMARDCSALTAANEFIDENVHGFDVDPKFIDNIKEKNDIFLTHIADANIRKELSRCTELITPKHVNKLNKITNDMLIQTVNDLEVWDVMIKTDAYSDREIRMLMAELDLYSTVDMDNLCKFIKREELKDYLVESINSGDVNLLHIKQAIADQPSVQEAINFLKNSCEICSLEFPKPEMCELVTCKHELCKICFFKYFKEVIVSKYPLEWNCPLCTNEEYLYIDKEKHYSQIRRILWDDKFLLKIFEEKLLLESFRGSPCFSWCVNKECAKGFVAKGKQKIQCPSCSTHMCANCKQAWHPQHEDRTCEQFILWILKNDPNLTILLKTIGIECPVCESRFNYYNTGSLHFTCGICGNNFCGGCYQLFVQICGKPNCPFTSFHGHHPRNCLYYLRDSTVKELEEMLEGYDYVKVCGKPEINCPFMNTDHNYKDSRCNRDLYNSTCGFCEIHYKEYLVQFIDRFQIDPADFADSSFLNLMLSQMILPKLTKTNEENEAQFTERLKKMVKENCALYQPKYIVGIPRANILD